jgi:hypothetical protein
MIKRLFVLLLIMGCSGLGLHAQTVFPLLDDISLVSSSANEGVFPPARLVLAVDMERDAYYKLSDRENTIKGGLVKRGINTISIEADDLFDKSGSHIYFLELKASDLMLREEIEIDIQLNMEEKEKKADNEIEVREFKLSMFIGDELVISSTKITQKSVPIKFNLPPWPDTYKPHNPIERTNSPFNSVSIFDALGVAYDLIKKMLSKKSEEKPVSSLPRQKQMTASFFRVSSEGATQEVKAVITLKIKESKIPLK